jgi:hypothetical protein
MSFRDVSCRTPGLEKAEGRKKPEIRGPKKRLAEPGIRRLQGQNEHAQKFHHQLENLIV